jgi:hypothetical protein
MSTTGTRIAGGRFARLFRNAGSRDHAAQASPAAAPPATAGEATSADTPYWLLWSTGAVAVVLGVIAFVLWGLNGAGTLFDMIVALCT